MLFRSVEQVGLVKFGEPGEKLGAVADGQLGQFFKDLRFAHAENLARAKNSRKFGFQSNDTTGEIRWRKEHDSTSGFLILLFTMLVANPVEQMDTLPHS